MPRDYFAPGFQVKVDGQRLNLDIARYITDLTVTHEPDTMDHFSLTLANPGPDWPWTHTRDAALFREGKAVEILIGYVDDLQPMFKGKIASARVTYPESGASSVRVEGHTEMQRLRGSLKTRTFVNMTDKQIAERIAGDVGLTPEADDTATQHAYVIQYNQSDQTFLVERARRIGFQLAVDGTKLLFKRAQASREPGYKLVWGHPREPVDGSRRVMPLRSFSPSLNLLNQVTKVIVRGQHPETREPFSGEAGPGDERLGSGSITGARLAEQMFGPRVEVIADVPLPSADEATTMARAIYGDRALNFITGTGATIGLPDLRAGALIELTGLGGRYSGVYYLSQTVHTINSGGYLTTFQVKRDGVDE